MSDGSAPVDGSRWVVPLADVLVDDELMDAARRTLSSGWWSMGPRVEDFEAQFAAFCECEHAIAVASGTAALHLALLAVECGPGDDVVLPSLNFVAAANTVVHVGARPVFCDIRGEKDLNLDPADLERALTSRTRAVIVLHYGGHACEIEPIVELCRSRGISVIEDAAHAIGTRRGGRQCGTFGDVGCFSFFSNKNLPVGEGGMLVTNDANLAERARLLRSHGMTTLTWDRHRGHASRYDVVLPGFNYRLDEIRAALASIQLMRLPERNAARAERAERYRARLQGRAGIVMPFEDDDTKEVAHHLAVVVLPEGSSRDGVRGHLADQRIQTSVHYPPIHGFEAYARLPDHRPLPQTDAIRERIVTLPLYPHMANSDVDLVSDTLVDALVGRHAGDV